MRGGIDVDREYKPGSVCRSMVTGGLALPYPACGQVDVIRPFAKKTMVDGENRISFNCFDESTQSYHSKFYAFVPVLLGAELHRGNGHRVEFNAEPKYPQIIRRIEGVQLPHPPKKTKHKQTP